MNVDSNAARLVTHLLAGEAWPALADRHADRVGPDLDPAALDVLPVTTDSAGGTVTAGARMTAPGKLAGNGIGCPPAGWDLDLQLPAPSPGGPARDGAGAASALRVQPDQAGHPGLTHAALQPWTAPGLELQ